MGQRLFQTKLADVVLYGIEVPGNMVTKLKITAFRSKHWNIPIIFSLDRSVPTS
jgi:hypothetical protein